MDIERFETIAKVPTRTKDDLIQMRTNALSKGEREFAAIAEEVLNERFPTWQKLKKSSGPTPTTANFKSESRDFDTGKDAYIWLVEKFQSFMPSLLSNQDKWHERAFKGVTRRYFARQPEELFPTNSSLAYKSGNFERVSGGWYVNTNLKHEQKFEILLRLAVVCRLSYPADWDFKVTGGTLSLAEKQKAIIESERLLDELLGL